MKKVLVTGTFDIIHPGHLSFLKQAKRRGNFLIAVIGRDATVKRVKGCAPYFNERERRQNLKALNVANKVVLGNYGDKLSIIEKLKPDIICLGYDQKAYTKNLARELKKRGLNPRITRLKSHQSEKHKTSFLHKATLVAIKRIDSTILTEPRYATRNNFLKKPLYRNKIVLVRRNLARKLKKVQRALRRRGLSLKIWDGYRPLSVQKQMWRFLPDERYIGNPAKKPFHTRAAAVDCTLVDKNGKELRMPTPYDEFSPRAHRTYPYHSKIAHKNILLLEKAMAKHGFVPLPTEWWHFSDRNWKRYSVLDIPL